MEDPNIQHKLQELEILKKKINRLYELNELSDEVKKEFAAENYKSMKGYGIDIPHLDKKYTENLYPKRKPVGKKIVLTESEIKEALEKSPSARKAARRLGVSYPTYKKYAKLYNIHATKGWPIKKGEVRRKGPINPFKGKYPLNEILENKHPNFPAHRLKDKLIRANYKEAKCENCGFDERRISDGKIPLLLNFSDGNSHNFTLENLNLFCYNCTFTCGKGYISRGPRSFDPDMLQGSKKELDQRF
jgi:predicted DNA-binding transcriptional regulator AlpA